MPSVLILWLLLIMLIDFSKENTVLRAHLLPEKVSVIPNAVECDSFRPAGDGGLAVEASASGRTKSVYLIQ